MKGFHHLAIRVKDFDASVKFYTEGLGFEPKISLPFVKAWMES